MSGKRKVLLALIILTLCFIWGQSLVPGEASSQESGAVLERVAPILEVIFGKGNVTDHLVRKLAHVIEYAMLGIEFTLLFNGQDKWVRTVICHCFLTGFLDETIQLFNGRGSFVSDVWLDASGSALGMAIVLAVIALKRKKE